MRERNFNEALRGSVSVGCVKVFAAAMAEKGD